jgi:cytoplasmic tRNA 2-thiolation protein 1
MLLLCYICCCSYGLDLFLLSIDEGIAGYRDDSLETVKRNEQTYGIPLKVGPLSSLRALLLARITRCLC